LVRRYIPSEDISTLKNGGSANKASHWHESPTGAIISAPEKPEKAGDKTWQKTMRAPIVDIDLNNIIMHNVTITNQPPTAYPELGSSFRKGIQTGDRHGGQTLGKLLCRPRKIITIYIHPLTSRSALHLSFPRIDLGKY